MAQFYLGCSERTPSSSPAHSRLIDVQATAFVHPGRGFRRSETNNGQSCSSDLEMHEPQY